jgi:hypothetical protein
MPEALKDRFFTRRSRHGTIAEKTADPGHVLIMLMEQDCEQPIRWNKTNEPASVIDDSESAFAMLNCSPGGLFLIDTRRHIGWVSIHNFPDPRVRQRAEQIFDSEDADELAAIANSDVGRTFELNTFERLA